MSFSFQSFEHAVAAVLGDVVKGFRAVVGFLPKVMALAPEIELVTGMIPGAAAAVPIERAAFAALGVVVNGYAQAKTDGTAAVAANGLNVSFDAQFVSDLEAILPHIVASLTANGVKVPASIAHVAAALQPTVPPTAPPSSTGGAPNH